MSEREVNGEKLVSDYLRAHADVVALDARVVGTTPRSTVEPWVRVRQIDAQQGAGDRSDHLVGFLLQLDCYAGKEGGQPEAGAVYRAVRGALRDIAGAHDEGVSTGARIVSAPRIPDTDFEPARERFVVTALAWAHP